MKPAWFVIAGLFPLSAVAQTQPDNAARRELLTQATQARDAGDNARALQAARQAAAMRSTPSLRLLIAEIEVSLGQVLPALADGRLCIRELEADRAYRDWQRYMESCSTLVRTQEARVGRLVVRVAETPGATVRVNGEALPEAQWGTTREVLAGRVVVDANAEGRAPFHHELTLVAGRTEMLDVRFEESSAAASATRAPARAVSRVADPAAAVAPPSRGAGAGPWVVMGLGVASFAAAGVFFALRQGALADRDLVCGNSNEGDCPVMTDVAVTRATELQGDAHTYNTLTNVAFGVGGAGLAGGLLWWIVGRSSGSSEPTTTVTVVSREGGVVFGLRGAM